MNNKPKNITLSELPKHNVYQVPEDYFDRLPTRIMERTAAAPQQAWLPARMWQGMRVAMAPLILLAMFVGVYYFTLESQPDQQAINMAVVTDTEIVDYLTANASLESADFAELNTIQNQELTADFLNVSPVAAEEELEYYHLRDTDY
ncbi:hypothetical protein JAO76_00330 [Pontibacter sp. BT310]|uniref:Uncharacterized protein n=1 Tax=Pontibacter populi TaxID=890055 RepID=A0ABS6X763_9BACT|nr:MULTISPECIES: hypothetical protein [Pontibacter]MBJ6116620.1 hypothetical protein [Pontibacter sp. BT310]MBR0569044.1 hypothetical protein [Microvirga sp. STS03]MBW3363474.1 hypothetical protein [Pontibacter populi]